MKEAVDLKQVVTFSQTMFRGHVHIHVATHNVKSTLWVGGWVFTSTPRRYLVESRGNLMAGIGSGVRDWLFPCKFTFKNKNYT